MDRTLRDVAEVGPFFAVRTGHGEPRTHGYRPLAELYATDAARPGREHPAQEHPAQERPAQEHPAQEHPAGEDTAHEGTAHEDTAREDPARENPARENPVRERAADVAARLGTPELRVGASLAFQGLAARLWSVALGAAVLGGRVPGLAAERLWWNPALSAPNDLWLPRPSSLPGTDDLAGQLAGEVLAGHLVPLHRATRDACPVADGLLWGNAGSALAGSLRVLHTWCVARGRTAQARTALDLAARLFRDPLLEGTGTLDPGKVAFVRRSCCLYYRIPGGGLCGDCVLR